MAKKQKRQVSQASAPAAEQSSASRYPVASSRQAASSAEFNPDYTHVVKDLKRIGVLAGSFVVVLVALSFILR
jgi:hypothetical protein